MLQKCQALLKTKTASARGGILFIVLPLNCIQNSRYMKHKRFVSILRALGFTLVCQKKGTKLIYYMFELLERPATLRTFPRKLVRGGKARNNFCLIIEGDEEPPVVPQPPVAQKRTSTESKPKEKKSNMTKSKLPVGPVQSTQKYSNPQPPALQPPGGLGKRNQRKIPKIKSTQNYSKPQPPEGYRKRTQGKIPKIKSTQRYSKQQPPGLKKRKRSQEELKPPKKRKMTHHTNKGKYSKT